MRLKDFGGYKGGLDVRGDMTGQYRYVQSTRRNNSKGMYSVQCARRYDRTVQVCTVYSAQCREYKEILQDSTDIYNVQCTELKDI